MGVEQPREAFAARLRALRAERGMSRYELHERSGVGLDALNRYEQARQSPTLDSLCRLAWGLGRDPADLLEGVPPDDSVDRGA